MRYPALWSLETQPEGCAAATHPDGLMIGVIAPEADQGVVREFFELFKTPWEPHQKDHDYDVILCTVEQDSLPSAKLTVVFGAENRQIDSLLHSGVTPQGAPAEVDWNGTTIPIYTALSEIESSGVTALAVKSSGRAAGVKVQQGGQTVVRIGYDLFREVAVLLTVGQPAQYATIPTIELHIAVLRELMIEAGVIFVEIPPTPYGYELVACLTHDVDFWGIRQHKLDHTMFGFLYRATWGTLRDALRGRVPWQKLRTNLKAAFTLPAVYLGLARDFWANLDEYLEAERGLNSTYFFLPYPDVPGSAPGGEAPAKRAGKYDIAQVSKQVLRLLEAGCEVGLHGIDAWHDPQKGRQELQRIASVSGRPVEGVRMHWLYFSDRSPAVLESTGLEYDSTCGYNDAVGFRAGTAQVFKPPGAERLLELPLLIQDTALLSSGRMGLAEQEALPLCEEVLRNVLSYGGALVVNWHTRSLSPERLWGGLYGRLLNDIRARVTWFGTAGSVASWFSKRRDMVFGPIKANGATVRAVIRGLDGSRAPALKLHVHGFGQAKRAEAAIRAEGELVLSLSGR